ncbi:hypothetical protein [Desmospora activa]|uniref:Uncharacterized protein n=1 Tax=Desmospora activa DSM 45169 TaxID=1121389 RepID=A0A2T4Z8L4_9BACL|nr:hypothetical protein [Desmospora activa]PTM58244.1 hypothetical protein C8J48_0824 [Desmospora activa DSM 45169]
MSENYTLKGMLAESEQQRFTIEFEEAELILDMPGPYNLKSWYVMVEGLNAESADRLDDCFYYGSPELILTMETPGGKVLRGEVLIQVVAVGPRSKARMNGRGMLEGVEAL